MKVVGVTIGWGGNLQLAWEQETTRKLLWFRWTTRSVVILPYTYELGRYPGYYPGGPGSWPIDPVTGRKLRVAE